MADFTRVLFVDVFSALIGRRSTFAYGPGIACPTAIHLLAKWLDANPNTRLSLLFDTDEKGVKANKGVAVALMEHIMPGPSPYFSTRENWQDDIMRWVSDKPRMLDNIRILTNEGINWRNEYQLLRDRNQRVQYTEVGFGVAEYENLTNFFHI